MNRSPEREILQEYIMQQTELLDAEVLFPGVIRLVMSTRTKARLIILGRVWDFWVEKIQEEDVAFRVFQKNFNRKEDIDPTLWLLAHHRAAEAILSVRQGHREHVVKLQRRKAVKEVERTE